MDLSEGLHIGEHDSATIQKEIMVDTSAGVECYASPATLHCSTSESSCPSPTNPTQPAPKATDLGLRGATCKISPDTYVPQPESPSNSFSSQGSTGLSSEDLPTPSPSNTWGHLSGDSTCCSSLTRNPTSETEAPESPSIMQRFFDRAWIQPAIGLTTLLVTLIALFVYSHRSFVMAKWTEENDMLQACAQLIQVISTSSVLILEDLQLMHDPGPTKQYLSSVRNDDGYWTKASTVS